MSRHTRFPTLRWLGLAATFCLTSLVAGCSAGTGPGVSDGPTWSLADKKPAVAVEKASERNALGAKADSLQPIAPPTSIIVVAKGDTLHGLALQNRSSVKALMAANSLTSHTIRPGQKLTVPASPK
jgi:LysM repeat protein